MHLDNCPVHSTDPPCLFHMCCLVHVHWSTDEAFTKQILSQVMDSKSPAAGSRLVARAWLDPAFRSRLLEDGNAAVAELGLDGSNWAARADAPPGMNVDSIYT